jgi:CspA family cold shock protein
MGVRGRVKWFNNRAGWGFIQRVGAQDVFVRHDRIRGEGYKVLHQGEEVEFEVRRGANGPYAVNVVRVEASADAGGARSHP